MFLGPSHSRLQYQNAKAKPDDVVCHEVSLKNLLAKLYYINIQYMNTKFETERLRN